jgi:hypothetical protein
MAIRTRIRLVSGLVGLSCLLAACGGAGSSTAQGSSGSSSPPQTGSPSLAKGGSGSTGGSPSESPVPPEQPVPTESSPPGDIPDNTAFVPYRAPGGFTLNVPEGWARTRTGHAVTFTDKLNTISAAWFPASSAPTVSSAKLSDVAQLKHTQRAFRLGEVKSVALPGGKAVLITYQANSDPNPVTGKQYRLDVERFELSRGGTEVALTLSSPVGADNVDPWRIVSESFGWS